MEHVLPSLSFPRLTRGTQCFTSSTYNTFICMITCNIQGVTVSISSRSCVCTKTCPCECALSAHLSVESYAVVSTEEPLFWVHHLSHLQIGAVDVIVQLRQPLWAHTDAHVRLNVAPHAHTHIRSQRVEGLTVTLKSLLFSKTAITGLLMSAMSSCLSDFHR